MDKDKDSKNIEREYIVPLRASWSKTPRYKRANKAVKTIKEFIARHMKVYDRDLNKIKIDRYLNEEVWFRGIKKPPAKIKVKAFKEGEIVRVELAVLPEKLKFKKAKEERVETRAAEKTAKSKVVQEVPAPKEESEEKKKETDEKKAATVEAMEKFEKQEHKKAKHKTGGKIDKAQQVRKNSLKAR